MSTLRDAVLDDGSDDENDPDFVPDEQPESDEEHERSSSVHQDRIHVESDAEKLRIAEKEARAKLWAEFQSSVSSSPSAQSAQTPTPPKTVKVVKHYRFAGEDVVEIAEVPEHSDDAKKWPKYEPSSNNQLDQNVSTSSPSAEGSTEKREPKTSNSTTTLSPKTASSSSSPTQTPAAQPPPRKPGPRKPKTLAAIPTARPKKLTTLEKSAMDWKAHLASETAAGSDIQDELAANRRGGGYLQKVDFLDRVGERREDLFDQARSAKRRRGGT